MRGVRASVPGGLTASSGARIRRSVLAESPGAAGPLLAAVPDVVSLLPDWDDPALAWQEKALCAEVDPDRWFPEKGGSVREAKRICAACEVRAECLAYALEHEDAGRYGIWGGLSERERRQLRRQKAA